jgi:hypothetical protein
MKIMGNTVGTTMPRSDWAQTNPKAADFIRNKPDIPALQKAAADAQSSANNAKTAADNAQRTANEAKNAAGNAQTTADNALPKAGGIMEGELAMGGFPITGVGDPSDGLDAANKNYVDSTFFSGSVVLSASGWTGNQAPYTQKVDMGGILETDNPHYAIVYSGSLEQMLAQKDAFALVDDLETEDGKLTFTCLEDKPGVDMTVQIEVNRRGIAVETGAVMMLNLEEGEETEAQVEVDGTSYGATNATVNSMPTQGTYDFTVL